MFKEMLDKAGLTSGAVYATSILKAREVRQLAADFRAQETIGPMTDRILAECSVKNEKAAGQGSSIVNLIDYPTKEISLCHFTTEQLFEGRA